MHCQGLLGGFGFWTAAPHKSVSDKLVGLPEKLVGQFWRIIRVNPVCVCIAFVHVLMSLCQTSQTYSSGTDYFIDEFCSAFVQVEHVNFIMPRFHNDVGVINIFINIE